MTTNEVFTERFQRVWDRFAALEKASAKADETFEVYRTSANEFRGALADQANRLLPRTEYTTRHDALIDRINSLEARMLQNAAVETGRTSGISAIGYVVISVIGAFVGIASIASVLVTLLHTPAPATESQAPAARLNALTGLLNNSIKKEEQK